MQGMKFTISFLYSVLSTTHEHLDLKNLKRNGHITYEYFNCKSLFNKSISVRSTLRIFNITDNSG